MWLMSRSWCRLSSYTLTPSNSALLSLLTYGEFVLVLLGGGEPICTSLLFPSVGKVLKSPGEKTEFSYRI